MVTTYAFEVGNVMHLVHIHHIGTITSVLIRWETTSGRHVIGSTSGTATRHPDDVDDPALAERIAFKRALGIAEEALLLSPAFRAYPFSRKQRRAAYSLIRLIQQESPEQASVPPLVYLTPQGFPVSPLKPPIQEGGDAK